MLKIALKKQHFKPFIKKFLGATDPRPPPPQMAQPFGPWKCLARVGEKRVPVEGGGERMTLVPIYLLLPYPCSLVQNAFKNASFIVKNSNKNLQGGLCPLCTHTPRSHEWLPPPGCVLIGWEKKDF